MSYSFKGCKNPRKKWTAKKSISCPYLYWYSSYPPGIQIYYARTMMPWHHAITVASGKRPKRAARTYHPCAKWHYNSIDFFRSMAGQPLYKSYQEIGPGNYTTAGQAGNPCHSSTLNYWCTQPFTREDNHHRTDNSMVPTKDGVHCTSYDQQVSTQRAYYSATKPVCAT